MKPSAPPVVLLALSATVSAALFARSSTIAAQGAQVRPPVSQPATPAADNNIALIDRGGHIETVTSELNTTRSAADLLTADPKAFWLSLGTKPFEQEVVISFLGRQAALISAVVINPAGDNDPKLWAKDVEVWTSTLSATDGFAKVAAASLKPESVDQPLAFAPVEARFVKVRILTNGGNPVRIACAKVKVLEASRPGYVSLLARNPEAAALVNGQVAEPLATPATARPGGGSPAASGGCEPPTAAPTTPPSHAESRNVLVLDDGGRAGKFYPPPGYKPTDKAGKVDYSLYNRIKFTRVRDRFVRPILLAETEGFDTVVLGQACAFNPPKFATFKKALMTWVSRGHKLIVQDSDLCGPSRIPDYTFLPYPFATSNPGAKGARGNALLVLEENALGNAKPDDPAFLNVDSWVRGENELGDSNVVFKYDARWCGHLFGRNAKNVNGFVQAYAHFGRGLIIYDGFDVDQGRGPDYRQLATRQLALGFDPDPLTCSVPLGDFIISTDTRLKNQPMVPGQTYTYPLTLFSNRGYKGKVTLSLALAPGDAGLEGRFEPATVELTDTASSTLTVTTMSAASPKGHALKVRGADAGGASNTLCLGLRERTTGGLKVVSALTKQKKPTRNLEIILDSSGSMKLPLGKKTRWNTALGVLDAVLDQLPADFNVGLRVYGHRQPSRSPNTCTDSQLVVPVRKLDKARILGATRLLKPKGETPLVYSILQTPADLKAVGGGSVILIADGEESCKGDPVAAARQLKESGLDVTLNIVGFTVAGRQVAAQLTQFAEATGGRYYGAASGEALGRALLMAAVEQFPYAVFDSGGKQVAKGLAGDFGQELAPGAYKVVITAGDQQLVADAVKIGAGGDTTLRIVVKGDRFAVAR